MHEQYFPKIINVNYQIGTPAYCLALYLTGVHFRGDLQHVGHVGKQNIKCRPIKTREIAGARLQDELYGHHQQGCTMALKWHLKILTFLNTSLIQWDHLNGRSQKIKKVSSVSSELDIAYGVPQDPYLVLCYLTQVFAIYFFVNITSDIANYSDKTTPYECDQHCDNLISSLELTVDKIFIWFEYNNLKANALKCHFFLSPYQHISININGDLSLKVVVLKN